MSAQLLRDSSQLLAGIRNFESWLPDTVMASDVDAIIEASIKGQPSAYLILEGKVGGGRVPTGQRRLFHALKRDLTAGGADVTMVYCWEKPNQRVFLAGDWSGNYSAEDFTKMVLDWWNLKKGVENG